METRCVHEMLQWLDLGLSSCADCKRLADVTDTDDDELS